MDYNNYRPTPPPYRGEAVATERINSVMKRVYLRMFIGMLITAFVSLGVASSPALLKFFVFNQWIYWGMAIAMVAMAWIIPGRLQKMSSGAILGWFCLYAALMGCFLSVIFIAYKLGSIVYTFFITAGVFGAMSVYGYFTKASLARVGSFCIMALIGLLIAMVVNIFWANNTLEWIISIVGVLLFVGLTAWDTQQIKQLANAQLDPSTTDKLATMGAMNLYLDFINLFLFLLRIFGGGRD